MNKKLKILHIALNSGGKPQQTLCNALKQIGEYREIDWIAIKERYGIPYLRNMIITMSEEFNPDITFMQLQTPGIIDAVIADQLKGFVINWTGDVRQPIPKWYYEIGRCINLTCFSNEHDVKEFHAAGLRAEFLNIGFDDTIFTPNGPIENAPEIVFLGSHYVNAFPLSDLRYKMVHMLRQVYGNRFACYGNGWDFRTRMLSEQEEAQLYRSCKIAINMSHFDLLRYSSDRIFRIMGSGAFCLSHAYKGIEQDFLINSELGIFNNLDDIQSKIDYYLNSHTREHIARAGCNYVHDNHTWQKRIKQLLNLIYEKQPESGSAGILA
jgi:hypothetical protein